MEACLLPAAVSALEIHSLCPARVQLVPLGLCGPHLQELMHEAARFQIVL